MAGVIWLAGDSILQDYGETASGQEDEVRQRGWGEYLSEQIRETLGKDAPLFRVRNLAMGGLSSRTFLEEGRLVQAEENMREGDLLLIQFGHNDASVEKPERYVAPEHFAEYLMQYIKTAREKGGIPILLSSVSPYPEEKAQKGEVGAIMRSLPRYADVMKGLAEEENICYVDMREATARQCLDAPVQTRSYYMPDGVHLTGSGAAFCARLAAEALWRERLL